ncbi:site-specific DNA-methyltransferase [Parageobacillus thermoglucosidasius]|uniref:DNA-methyltransferase n=1 Tax=Parageobacillus thermoglucosidasius TaxID=1426 RepID=UPI003D2B22F8
MRFFSVFDLVVHHARLRGHSETQMYSFFRKRGIKKADLLCTKDTGMIPTDDRLLDAILNYLDMSKLELELALGRIPSGYEHAYLQNVKEIAKLLESSKPSTNNDSVPPTVQPYFLTEYGKLFKGDCLKLFKMVPDESVDCIFADPPFNLDKEYDDGVDDSKSYSTYISWCFAWLDECVRVLKPGGSLFIYNIPKWHTYLSNYLNDKLNFWAWIAVDMKFNLPIPNRLYPAHYSLLYYVKGNKPKTFNPQRIPIQTCRHCGGEIKDYGGYKNKMNPNGVNLSDVWTDIYPVRHSNSKNRKYNELPVKLLDRVITMSTNENDVVLDPFGGSGTTYAVCELLKRRWIGFEVGNCEVIKQRLENKEKDIELLKRVYEEKNKLFPDKVKELRRKNGFWLAEDFMENKEHAVAEQITLSL